MKDFSDFTGPVSPKTLITAVTDTLDSSHLSQLNTTAQHDTLMQQDPKLAKVLLFTDKPASTVLAKGLSWAYARRLVFAEVRPSGDEGKALAAKYGVEKYPTILVVKVRKQQGKGLIGVVKQQHVARQSVTFSVGPPTSRYGVEKHPMVLVVKVRQGQQRKVGVERGVLLHNGSAAPAMILRLLNLCSNSLFDAQAARAAYLAQLTGKHAAGGTVALKLRPVQLDLDFDLTPACCGDLH